MLSEQLRRLLTAYVDGELSHRQRRAVRRALRASEKARDLLVALQQDAECLRRLPRPSLGEDFTRRVVRAVAARPVVRASRRGARS